MVNSFFTLLNDTLYLSPIFQSLSVIKHSLWPSVKYRSHIQFHEYLLLFPQHQPDLGPKDFLFPPFSQWGVKVAGWGGMWFASGSPPPLPFFGSALVLKVYWAAGREYRRSYILMCVVCHLFPCRTMDIFVI